MSSQSQSSLTSAASAVFAGSSMHEVTAHQAGFATMRAKRSMEEPKLLQLNLDCQPFRFQEVSGQLDHIASVGIAFCGCFA